jgi:hypothetical protein
MTGRRAALGELTGAAATGGEGAGRLRGFSSATSNRYIDKTEPSKFFDKDTRFYTAK